MRRILEYNCVIWYKKNSKLKTVQLEKFIKIVQMASKCEKKRIHAAWGKLLYYKYGGQYRKNFNITVRDIIDTFRNPIIAVNQAFVRKTELINK